MLLLRQRGDEVRRAARRGARRGAGLGTDENAAALGAFPGGAISSVAAIGRSLFTDYAFAFEVTSVLILVAMLGAVVLAHRRRRAIALRRSGREAVDADPQPLTCCCRRCSSPSARPASSCAAT